MNGMFEFQQSYKVLLPGVPLMLDALMSSIQNKPVIDIISLDAWMVNNDGYVEDDKISLQDHIKSKYGERAAEFVADH